MSRLVLVVASLALLCASVCVSARGGSFGSDDASLLSVNEFEGQPCEFSSMAGICTSGPCNNGNKILGKCAGPSQIQCCVSEDSYDVRVRSGPIALKPKLSVLGSSSSSSMGTGIRAKKTKSATAIAAANGACKAAHGKCTLTESLCDGTRVSGLCPGTNGISCCIAAGKDKEAKAKPHTGGSGAVPIPPEAAFTYTFPYHTGRHIVADFALQRIRLYEGATALKEWKISSGINGVGFKPDSGSTPSGKFLINMRVGDQIPLNTIFDGLKPTTRLGKPTDASAHMQTRIMVLDGQDAYNKNTAARGVFIHGTNYEHNLGRMDSHGCFRMANADVVELFDSVARNTPMWAAPKNAWPTSSIPTGTIPKLK